MHNKDPEPIKKLPAPSLHTSAKCRCTTYYVVSCLTCTKSFKWLLTWRPILHSVNQFKSPSWHLKFIIVSMLDFWKSMCKQRVVICLHSAWWIITHGIPVYTAVTPTRSIFIPFDIWWFYFIFRVFFVKVTKKRKNQLSFLNLSSGPSCKMIKRLANRKHRTENHAT